MVNLIDCSREEFVNRTKKKKLYGFGTGKYLQRFADNIHDVSLEAVIDNYRYMDQKAVLINDKFVKVISADVFSGISDTDRAVVITCLAVEEILEQLDFMPECDGMDCYAEFLMEHYESNIGIGVEDKMEQAGVGSRADTTQSNDELRYGEKVRRIRNHNKEGLYEGHYEQQNLESEIKRFQIWECLGEDGTAGSKAPMDIKKILGMKGYQVIDIHSYGGQGRAWSNKRLALDWDKCYQLIPPGAILLLQHPFLREQKERNRTLLMLKEKKHIRIVSLVHDVDRLRGRLLSDYSRDEFEFMLQIADVLIVHNEKMMNYFLNLGVEEKRLVSLGIFDYLSDGELAKAKTYEKSISIAGNLILQKSPYIAKLQELTPIKVHLYGPNYTEVNSDGESVGNLIYHGVFPSDIIWKQLNSGFGLVWDGSRLDTCAGGTGDYLRYNNPHKLSLYLAAGLPVIIWKGAAEAVFVRENGVGLVIDSLLELPAIFENMDEQRYRHYLEQVSKITSKVTNGWYTEAAIQKAERMLARNVCALE